MRDLEVLDAQVAFLGVPYDGGTPQPGIPTGQRAGPATVREASVDVFHYPRSASPADNRGAEGWYDVEADRDYLGGVRMADVGDDAIQGSDTEANYERITRAARRVVERGALLVAVGGDHSMSYPLGFDSRRRLLVATSSGSSKQTADWTMSARFRRERRPLTPPPVLIGLPLVRGSGTLRLYRRGARRAVPLLAPRFLLPGESGCRGNQMRVAFSAAA